MVAAIIFRNSVPMPGWKRSGLVLPIARMPQSPSRIIATERICPASVPNRRSSFSADRRPETGSPLRRNSANSGNAAAPPGICCSQSARGS